MQLIRELLYMLGGRLAVQTDGTFFLPVQGSSTAPEVDHLFGFIFYLCLFFFALIVFLMVAFVVRYRRRAGREEPEPSPDHNGPLEITWTVIPIALVIVLFAWGFKVFMDINTPPANAYEIQVTGQKWKWLFTYPDGHVDEELHVPVDTPVKLVMTSEDVIHGFYIPAFRIKHDVIPGRYAKLWFKATKPGEYQLFCTQYCGTGHSNMLARVVVHQPGGFERWLANASNFLKTMPPAQAGEKLYRTRGCAQCHSVDGTAGIGPSFKGVFGHQVPLSTGKSVLADEDYVRESIMDPQAKIVAGFQPVMPTFKGRLTDQEITAIIAYLKTLK